MFLVLAASVAFLAAAPTAPRPAAIGANSAPAPILIGVDPLTASSQGGYPVENQTAVGPVIATNGYTSVTVFQTGRYTGDASAAMGFATNTGGGTSWYSTLFGNLTKATNPGNPYDRITFESVAWNQRYNEFLVSMLPIVNVPDTVGGDSDTTLPPIVVRSSNGYNWTAPTATSPTMAGTRPEKNFITCDNSPYSRYYGTCYVVWDDNDSRSGFQFHANVSTDGGQTWGPTRTAADGHNAYGALPVVLPNGTVVVTSEDGNGFDGADKNIISSVSTDGGTTWSSAYEVSPIIAHTVAGNMRTQPLPTTAVDGYGNIYTVWQDCRFETGCATNDLIMSTSRNGINWSTPTRINLDAPNHGYDHFLPSISIRNSWFGATLGISYYELANGSSCTPATCILLSAFANSGNGGASWSNPALIYGPMYPDWLATTGAGYMVGDYLTSVYPNAYEAPVTIAGPPNNGTYNEPIAITPWSFFGGLGQSNFTDAASKKRPVKGLGAADNAALHVGGRAPTYRAAALAPRTVSGHRHHTTG